MHCLAKMRPKLWKSHIVQCEVGVGLIWNLHAVMIFVTSFTMASAPCWDFLIFLFCFVLLQGKATGNEAALWLRAPIQYELFKLGCRLQRHAGKVLFLGILILAILSVGMKSATLETRVEKLWVQGKKKKYIYIIKSKYFR